MTLIEACMFAAQEAEVMVNALTQIDPRVVSLQRALSQPAVEFRGDFRSEMFRAALNDPRLSMFRAQPAQTLRPDFRGTIRPGVDLVGRTSPQDPRRTQGRIDPLTFRALFVRRDRGGV